VTWGVADRFGGMTRAMLHRSRAFVRLGGVPVDVLTFDHRDDYPQLEQRLRDEGELVHGMRLLNIWDWFRDQGTPAQEHVDDEGRRRIVVRDASGEVIRESGPWAFYRHWLDRLRSGDPAFVIVDSKTAARFAATYRRKNVAVLHVVHNSHLGPDGQLRGSRRDALEQLDRFDTVVVLSERQRDDMVGMLGHAERLAVVPNATDRVRRSTVPRGDAGVVVASLDGRKRVDHAVRAAQQAGVPLDVFGDGPKRQQLEALGTDAVFHGHRPLQGVYPAASLLLLTSKAEGFPLVLLEAMAAGCIPIAYDVPYGPADIITDGVDGYLVREGDIDGLAARIREFTALPPRARARMRRAARRRAAAFSDRRVTRRWAGVLAATAARHRAEWRSAAVG